MIRVAGYNRYNQLIVQSNNRGEDNFPCVNPPMNAPLNTSDLLSFSIYSYHAVWITKDGKACASGSNDGQIWPTLPREILNQHTFEVTDQNNHPLKLHSAVCGDSYTLYMSEADHSSQSQLIYVHRDRKNESPLYVNLGSHVPVSLFGGKENACAIDKNGEIIMVKDNIFDDGESKPIICKLPNNERAVDIACCEGFTVSLSQTGKVYMNRSGGAVPVFKEVDSLRGIHISNISGTYQHCLAVSEEGCVFVFGMNDGGVLGIEMTTTHVDPFTQNEALNSMKIIAGYAGFGHTLFQTSDGKILACGFDNYGELLDKAAQEDIYLPAETDIKNGAKFCIAGNSLSVVFTSNPPANTPNMKIE